MIQFAVNYSPEASALLAENAIAIDRFKCPDWPDLVQSAQAQRPVYVHFPIVIGSGQYETWDFAAIENWLNSTATLFVNSHITPNKTQFSEDMPLDDLSAALIKEVEQLVSQFGAERVIIENTPLYAGNQHNGYLKQGIEPQLIQNIVQATGCGFLFDISHSKLTSEFMGWDWHSYVHELPLQHMRELHVTGIGKWTNGNVGDHMPLTAMDWSRFEIVMNLMESGVLATPQVVAFEYGGVGKLKDLCGSDRDALARDVPRLYRRLRAMRQI